MSRPTWVLGISASHNGAACLLGSGLDCLVFEDRIVVKTTPPDAP